MTRHAVLRATPRLLCLLCGLLAAVALPIPAAWAQIAPERSLDELKAETLQRVAEGRYPATGLKVEDAREALSHVGSLDPDEWGKAWSAVGDRYMAEARTAAGQKAHDLYDQAFLTYNFARFPVANSPAKRQAYGKAVDAFLAAAKLDTPTLEVVHIPFEGQEIVGYLRLPAADARPAPLVFAWGGLDYLKEQTIDGLRPFLKAGFATFSVDIPGTGQAPLLASPTAERMFSRVLDALQTRPEIDARQIYAWGTSMGGYWATKLAFVEKDRLAGVIDQGGPVDSFFEPAWQMKALGTREYLMNLLQARAAIYGVETLDQFLAASATMSLAKQGLLDRPSAPMLLLNGAKDTQVPIADLTVLLLHGTAKDAWVNPQAGHVGLAKNWSMARLSDEVVMPWIKAQKVLRAATR